MCQKTFILLSILFVCASAVDRLAPGSCLIRNQQLDSANGCFKLIMQQDGNLVLYRKSNNVAIWNSLTPRSCTNRACMQTDGNFVAYDCQNVATWHSHTPKNEGSYIVVQNDGNLVIYAWQSKRPIWSTGTVTNC